MLTPSKRAGSRQKHWKHFRCHCRIEWLKRRKSAHHLVVPNKERKYISCIPYVEKSTNRQYFTAELVIRKKKKKVICANGKKKSHKGKISTFIPYRHYTRV
ncbi:hypothetical protein, unlikely [Trypanosoma brucei gambiense DAL972]|uniref:Uncharacterized protein n=1 Tax=Trypanosoma brucei gambiense (strain MHOM/CI/86/DAL972) TaxID=679716 RepID=D0A347_TRYB9|nr:hypothetical protein, unlikely [Trypanosoma brucei gambiense DAL972]CBH15691.1 hypothetical protein, unlikely [Trypanosoma brucei gambiense DAL972]|eukprot:XP_011777955.1 hypothetical protein, unlikely [Trypanosoma brucei gambiense DAL972]